MIMREKMITRSLTLQLLMLAPFFFKDVEPKFLSVFNTLLKPSCLIFQVKSRKHVFHFY